MVSSGLDPDLRRDVAQGLLWAYFVEKLFLI